MNLFRLMSGHRLNSSLWRIMPGLLLLAVLSAGWVATAYLGRVARQEIIGENNASALTLSTYLSSALSNLEGAVKSLAGSPGIPPVLMSDGARAIERANSTLDRYNAALNASVSYVMDADGMTVASSNRNDPDSLVGKSYRFRPYFQEAAKGQAGRYFALGITSGKRGFYASYPVQNTLGHVLGVVAMKKELDDMALFFSRFPLSFLISPDGIVFLSSSPAMVLKTLWPLDKGVRAELIASRQFGTALDETSFFGEEIVDGAEVTLEGQEYYVSRSVIDPDRWSIVLLTPTDRIMLYQWIGILATFSVSLLIMIFSGIIYLTDRSREAVRLSEEGKRLLLRAAGDGIFGVDAAGRLTFVNPAALLMLGFAEEEVLGQQVHGIIHHSREDGAGGYPEEECPMHASYTQAAERHVTEVLWRKDGSSFPVEYTSMPITKDGKIMGAVVTFRDITERRRAEAALRESEEKYRSIFENAPLGLLHFDKEGITTSCNDKFVEIIGSSREALRGLNMLDLPDRQIVAAVKLALNGKQGYYDEEYRSTTANKTTPIHALFTPITSERGEVIGGVGLVEDVTERKQAEEKIRQMAYHDSLTGLPNRKLFSDRLGIALAQAQRNQKGVAVTMLDLDNFKDVNDTLGHDMGDLLLKAATGRLSAALRKGDTVARFGGDEFILILPNLRGMEDAIQVAQKILESFREPFLIDTHRLVVTTSIGIAVFPADGTDEGTLLKNADIAMYQAKQTGRARYRLFGNTANPVSLSTDL